MNELHRFETVHSRHEDVDDEEVEASRLEQLKAAPAGFDCFDRMCCAFQQHLDGRQNRTVVVDDENARHGVSLTKLPVLPMVTYFLLEGQAADKLGGDVEALMVDSSLRRNRSISPCWAAAERLVAGTRKAAAKLGEHPGVMPGRWTIGADRSFRTPSD